MPETPMRPTSGITKKTSMGKPNKAPLVSPEPPYRTKPIREPGRGSYSVTGRSAKTTDSARGISTSYRETEHVRFRDCDPEGY
jgi:hypothetical protein